MTIPGMRKGGGHHIVVSPLLRELTILLINTNTMMLPSLGLVYSALLCGPEFCETLYCPPINVKTFWFC